MKRKPKTFADLSPERQTALVQHFVDEFNLTEQEAREDCEKLSGKDFELHLDACENGYM